MSDHLESYSYQHGSGAVPHHLPSISSSRLRRRSLRISLLPPESEDITLNSINEEDLPEDDRSFDPQADPEPPSIYDRHASDYSDNSLSDNPGSQQCHWPSQAAPPHSSIASNGTPTRTRPAKKTQSKRKNTGGKKKRTQVSVEESLQGLGPIPVRNAQSSSDDVEQPHIYASISGNSSSRHEKPSTLVWRCAYGLTSVQNYSNAWQDWPPITLLERLLLVKKRLGGFLRKLKEGRERRS
jgi:hypothetical protein